MIEIELQEPGHATCDCCGGVTTKLTRFVYRDGSAHAIYYATFAPGHDQRQVAAVVSIGRWGEGSGPADRIAVALMLRPGDEHHAVSVVEPETSPWHGVELLGRFLTRREALGHASIDEVFHITDHMVLDDPPLRHYLEGVVH